MFPKVTLPTLLHVFFYSSEQKFITVHIAHLLISFFVKNTWYTFSFIYFCNRYAIGTPDRKKVLQRKDVRSRATMAPSDINTSS